MPIDHVAMNVTDLERSKAFYSKALEPLGYSLVFELEGFLGFADAQMPNLGVVRRDPAVRTTADRVREHYHPTYYAAFVRDPDGNNVEAVTHKPE